MGKKNHDRVSLDEQYDRHKLKMREIEDMDNYNDKRERRKTLETLAIIGLFIFLPMIVLFIFGFSAPKNPSLSSYNSLTMGMSYEECKKILGSEGHLTVEKKDKTTYVWYDAECTKKKCPVVIELDFENDELVKRNEKGLR